MCWLERGRERVGEEGRECRGQEMARIMQVNGEIMRSSDGVGAKVTISQELLTSGSIDLGCRQQLPAPAVGSFSFQPLLCVSRSVMSDSLQPHGL